jgi:L-arabinose isomerase
VESKLKTGPIRVLGFTQTADGSFKMIASDGESVPGLLEIPLAVV